MARVYMISPKGEYYVTAEYAAPDIVILKGSRIDMTPRNDIIRPSVKSLRSNRNLVDTGGVVLEDVSFTSVSAATMFVLGCNENVYRCWKAEDGKPISGENQNSAKPAELPCVASAVTQEVKIAGRKRANSPFTRLRSRILREIKRKKFLGDIPINDEEYAILVDYIHRLLTANHGRTLQDAPDVCVAVGLVQVGIRFYDGNYWSPAADAFSVPDLKKPCGLRTQLGSIFQNTLVKYAKAFTNANETVQNILMHGFVSNYYADQYFDFLYAFYRLDLGRNISQMDTAAIRALFDSIAHSASARIYMIRGHVHDAVIANPIGSKIRLRRHLRLIDNFFWNENYRLHTNNRIYALLQDWVDKNNRFESERKETGIHRRGKKAFSSPHFRTDYQQGTFRLYLPAQLLPRDLQTHITIHISIGDYRNKIPADIVEIVTAYRTEPVEILVPAKNLLEEVSVCLVAGEDTVIRKFTIPAEDVRFFDEEGYSENPSSLKNGAYFAYTKPQMQLISAALVGSRILGVLQQWYLDLECGDFIQLPNGTAVFVGKANTEGPLGRGRLNAVQAAYPETPQDVLPVYTAMPEIVIRSSLEKADGILLAINGVRHRVSEENGRRFSYDDGTKDVGFHVRLAQVAPITDGRYDIHIDIPNGSKRWYSFLLLQNLEIMFDGAPYIFEPRGSLTLRCSESVTALDSNCKNIGNGQFDFEIQANQRDLRLRVDLPNSPVLKIRIPALFWRYDDGEWNWEQPEELWHKELPGLIEIVAPCEKAALHIDDLQDEESDLEQKPIAGEKRAVRDGFVFDTTRLKTYLEAGPTLRTIYLDMDQLTKRFVQIVTRSTVVQCTAYGHFETRQIAIKALVIGKANYYVDVSLGEHIVAEKAPLVDSVCLLDIPDGLSSGEYEIELFESEQDNFGFGEAYESLGVYHQKLANPYDMRGTNLELVQLHRENDKKSPLLMIFTVAQLQSIPGRNNFYNGQMIVAEKGRSIAAYPVIVEFIDYSMPDRVRLYFDDEGEDTQFLYDAVRRIIVKQEDSGISRGERYRRFEVLYDNDIFEVRLTEKIPPHTPNLPDHIPTWSSQGKGADVLRGLVRNKFNPVAAGRSGSIQQCWEKIVFKSEFCGDSRVPRWMAVQLSRKGIYTYAQALQSLKSRRSNLFRGLRQADAACLAEIMLEIDPSCAALLPDSIRLPQSAQMPDTPLKQEKVSDALRAPSSVAVLDEKPPVPEEVRVCHQITEVGIPPLIYNKLKKVGIHTLEDVGILYQQKGMKGICNINGCTKKEAEKIVFCLRQYNLI